MRKPAGLRAHLLAANPALARDNDKLALFVEGGHIVSSGSGTLSFEYAYTLVLTVLDYAGPVEAIVVPILAWLRCNQPELLDNPEQRERAFRFQAEVLNSETADITLELDLTERVIVSPVLDPARHDVAGRYTITPVDEPPVPGACRHPAEHWELWWRDEAQLAAWDLPAQCP